MRVLLVTDWPPVAGGVETYVLDAAKALRSAGDDVLLLTSGVGDGASIADVVARSSDRLPAKAALQVANPFASRAARRAVASFRPDVAYVSMFEMYLSPSVLRGLGRLPYVLNVGYYKPVCPNGLKLLPSGERCAVTAGPACRAAGCVGRVEEARARIRYRRIASALARARATLTCSAWMVQELQRAGVAAHHFPWPVAQSSAGFERRPSADPLLTVVGRLAREKGVATLVDALGILRRRGVEARLRVVGDGPERLPLARRAQTLGVADRIEWVGIVPHDAVEGLLADPWALVAPSLWAEPLGLTAIEAIVRRLPVVASAVGGYGETVEDGVSGLLFPNGDAAALAERLAAVVSRQAFPELRVPAAAAARLAARHDPLAHATALRAVLARAAA